MPRQQKSYKNIVLLHYLLFNLIIFSGCQKATTPIIPQEETIKVNINQTEFILETTPSTELQQKGLMFRNNLPQKHGMFFEFETSQILSFWMKNTYIPLDIIFIDKNKVITNIAKNTPPCKEIDPTQQNCPSYQSSREAKYVIELNAGETDKYNISTGQIIDL